MVKDPSPLIIVTARIGSSRLPGKVLKPFWKDYCLLEFLIRRLQTTPETSRIALATVDTPENEPVAEIGKKLSVKVIRGSENNVVERMNVCLKDEQVPFVSRVTADNPFTDPVLFGLQLKEMKRIGADYSYCREAPKGVAADIWTTDCFKETVSRASTKYQLEHANAWVWDHPDCFNILWFIPPIQYIDCGFNLSIDTEDDYIRIKKIFSYMQDPLSANFLDLTKR